MLYIYFLHEILISDLRFLQVLSWSPIRYIAHLYLVSSSSVDGHHAFYTCSGRHYVYVAIIIMTPARSPLLFLLLLALVRASSR